MTLTKVAHDLWLDLREVVGVRADDGASWVWLGSSAACLFVEASAEDLVAEIALEYERDENEEPGWSA